MFNVGEKIYYPMHGVGVIEAIQEQNVLGRTGKYYMLRFLVGRMTAMVPVETAEAVGLRPIVDSEECKKVLDFMLQEGEAENDNWNQRYRDNLDKLKTGDIYEVALVVKNLLRRDREKGLSTGEKKMLINAKQVLFTELSVSGHIDVAELEARFSG